MTPHKLLVSTEQVKNSSEAVERHILVVNPLATFRQQLVGDNTPLPVIGLVDRRKSTLPDSTTVNQHAPVCFDNVARSHVLQKCFTM